MYPTSTRPDASRFAQAITAWLLCLFLALISGSSALGAFGLATATDYYTVDTGAGLVFKVRRTDNGSSTQSAGDIMSLVYNNVEYQDQSRGSQINSGFDFLGYSSSSVSVSAEIVNTNYVKVTVIAGDLKHYYIARNGYPHIYMATYFTTEPVTGGALCRYIFRIPADKLPNGPTPSDIRSTDFTVESGDIFGFSGTNSNTALRGQTRSKHYSNMRLKDWSYIGAVGSNVGMWMVRDNQEGGSGGPFYRSLLNQCGSDQEITYIINYGEGQTEALRTGILNSYTMVFTNGSPPSAVDTSWFSTMDLTGYVPLSGRGSVTCSGISGRDGRYAYTVGFSNGTAQYWTDASAANGSFTMSAMIPGTYTMRVYKNELSVNGDTAVTVSPGVITTLNPITITGDPSAVVPLWRIGNWDGTPTEFLHGDKVTIMHPSDVRITGTSGTAAWSRGPYVTGTSSPATNMPCYQWKDVNGSQVVQFTLTSNQLAASTIRIGITVAFEGARPKINVNAWSSSNPTASNQPETRTLTVGTYRGNNTTYTFSVPASAFVAGTNTLTIFPISGSGASQYLSAGYSLDCLEMFQGSTTASLPAAPSSLSATPSGGDVALSWAPVGGATSYLVQRATVSGGPYVTVAEPSSTSYTDTGAGAGKAYYYIVNAANTAGAGLPSPEAAVAMPGALVYLRFDEASGTSASDASGNGQNGTLSGGATFGAGKIGNAVTLSGSSQFVSLPAGVVGGLNDFTISTWIRVSAFNTWARVFDFGTGTDNYMFLTTQYSAVSGSAAKMRFGIRTSAVAEQAINSTTSIPVNTWVHAAVTLSGTTGRLYLNGTQVGSNPSMTLKPSSLGNSTLNYLGKSQFSDPYLNGSLDDFRIYRRALSAAEITARANLAVGIPEYLTAKPDDGKTLLTWAEDIDATTYNIKRATVSGGPYTTVPGGAGLTVTTLTDTGLTNGTIYYYVVTGNNAQGESGNSTEVAVTPTDLRIHLKFDEASGATAVDSSGRGLDAVTVNNPVWEAGKLNNAVKLTAASSQYVNLPSGVPDGLTNFTAMAWVKFTSVTAFARIFDFGGSTAPGATSGAYIFLAPIGSSTLRFAITASGYNNEQGISAATPLSTGTWMHVAVSLSGSAGKLYVNGALIGTNNAMTLTPTSLGSLTQRYIGKSLFSGDPYLNGSVDDFRIYSRAMSESEISTVAGIPPPAPLGLVATGTSGSVALRWNASTGATGYTVLRSLTSGTNYAPLTGGTTAATSYTDTGLANGTTYYYVVRATGGGGTSANSGEASATTYTAVENWRMQNFGTAANAGNAADSADPDADGSTNAKEFGAGTDPKNASSVLKISDVQSSGNDMILSFPTVVGKTYRVEWSTLQSGLWTPVQDNIAGTGGTVSVTDTNGALEPKRFYRVILP